MADSAPPHAPRVLVVDDDPDIQDALAELLRQDGYAVEVAGDGAEALERLQKRVPGLVLLDLMMPGMSGWEFRAIQRQNPLWGTIPLIVISAVATPEITSGLDPVAVFKKPFDLDALLLAVEVHYRTPATQTV